MQLWEKQNPWMVPLLWIIGICALLFGLTWLILHGPDTFAELQKRRALQRVSPYAAYENATGMNPTSGNVRVARKQAARDARLSHYSKQRIDQQTQVLQRETVRLDAAVEKEAAQARLAAARALPSRR